MDVCSLSCAVGMWGEFDGNLSFLLFFFFIGSFRLQNTLRAATSRLGRPVYNVSTLTEMDFCTYSMFQDFPSREIISDLNKGITQKMMDGWVEYGLFYSLKPV